MDHGRTSSGALVHFLAAAIWFLLPAGAASTAPVLVKRVPVLDRPVDGGRTLRGEPIFGRNKTWRGLVAAPLAGLAVFALQQALAVRIDALRDLALVGPVPAPLGWGAVLGAGAILGDLVKSFAKRRVGVAPGRSWFPFDQLDYAAGAVLALAPFAWPGARVALGVIAVGLGLHVVAVVIGKLLGVRERWI